MKTYTHKTNFTEYQVPDTTNFTRAEFNSISHKININKHDDELVSQYGSYSIDIDFAHDDVQTKSVIKGKEVIRTGGIDLRLKSISNLKSKGAGLRTLKESTRSANKSTQFANDVKAFFKDELTKLKVNRRYPDYYTGSIKHKTSKRILDKTATMIVEQVDSLLVFIVIGEVKYQFETKRGGSFTEKQTMAHSRFTAYNNDELKVNWYDDDEFDLLDEFGLDEENKKPKRKHVMKSLKIEYDIEPVTVQVTPEQASAITNTILNAVENSIEEHNNFLDASLGGEFNELVSFDESNRIELDELESIFLEEFDLSETLTPQEAVELFKRDFPKQYENWLSISDESVLTKEWFLTKLNAHIENGRLLRPTSMLNSINKHFSEYKKTKKAQREHQEAEQQFLKDISQ